MGVCVKNKSAEQVLVGMFRWIGIFGRPEKFLFDNGLEFINHELKELASRCGVRILSTAVEAPYSNGICERGNATIGEMVIKVLNDIGCDPEVAVQSGINAKNTLSNVYGFSPQQLVLGKNTSIHSEEINLPSLNESTSSQYVADNLNAIKTCRAAFAEIETQTRIKRALRTRGNYSNAFIMGDLVYYKRENRKEWLGPATVIGARSGCVWIDHGNVVKIHPCRVRLVTEADEAINDRSREMTGEIEEEPVNSYVQPQVNEKRRYLNEDEEQYQVETHAIVEIDDELRRSEEDLSETDDLENKEENNYPIMSPESGDDAENEEVRIEEVTTPTMPELDETIERMIDEELTKHYNDTSEVVVELEETSLIQLDDDIESAVVTRSEERSEEVVEAGVKEQQLEPIANENVTIESDNESEDIAAMVSAIDSSRTESSFDDLEVEVQHSTPKEPASKSVRELINEGKVPLGLLGSLKNTIMNKISFSNNDDEKQVINDQESSDETSNDHEDPTTNMIFLEVPRNRYKERSVQEAMQTELEQFKEYGVYKEVENTGQTTISTRWVVTEKTVNGGEKVTKARLVCRGFEEDVDQRVDSPTVTKVSLRLMFCIMMSKNWKCHSIDIKGAFLQSDPLDHDVYIKAQDTKDDSKLWKLIKPLYGLKYASKKWFQSVRRLLKELGCEQSQNDSCVFVYYINEELCGLMCTHVDDFLACGIEEFELNVIGAIKEAFQVSKHEVNMFSYVGLEVNQQDNQVLLSQRRYQENILPIETDAKARMRILSAAETTQYRELLGKLTWLVTQTRPDYRTAVLEASFKIKQPKISDLKNLNRILADMRMTPGYSLSIVNLGSLEDLVLSVYCDASCTTQGVAKEGIMILLSNGISCNVIAWFSKKIQKTCLHAFDAEVYAVVRAIKEAVLINELIGEILKLPNGLKLVIHCDCKSLRTKLYGQTYPKECRKEINWITEQVMKGDINSFEWIDRSEQIADALTKEKSNTLHLLNLAVNHNQHPGPVFQ